MNTRAITLTFTGPCVLKLEVPNTTTFAVAGEEVTNTPPFTLPTVVVLTPPQQAAKTEALKTALPMAQTNPVLLRKYNDAFYELMTSRSDAITVRMHQQNQVGQVNAAFQALVENAPAEGRVDVLIGIWSACQEALKTVK